MRRRARITVMAAVVAVLATPLIAAVVAWRRGWMPIGDDAAVLAQSWGTFSAHPPLLGNYASVTSVTDASQTLYHPGPLQLWLLAGPQHLFAPSNLGALVGSALLVTAALALVLVACRRAAGVVALAPMVVLVAWFMAASGAQALRSPYMGTISMFMLLGLVGAAWAVLDRDDWFWPAVVVTASVAVQAQVSFAVSAAAILCAVVGVRAVTWWRDRAAGRVRSRRRAWTITGVTAGVAAVCWVGPLYDQFFGSGNLWELLTAGAGAEAVGPSWGWNRLVDSLAFPPAWTFSGARIDAVVRPEGHMAWHTPGLHLVGAAVFTVAFVVLARRCVRRRNRPLVMLAVLAVASIVGAFVASVLMPDEVGSLIGHTQPWRVASFVAWSFVAVAAVEWIVAAFRGRASMRSLGRLASAAVAGCLVAVVVPLVLTLARSSPSHDMASVGFGAVDRFATVGADLCAGDPGGIVVTQDGFGSTLTTVGLVAELQHRGCTVHVSGDLRETLSGDWFRPSGDERVTLRVASSRATPAGFREVSVYDPGDPPASYRGFDTVYELMQRSDPVYLQVHRG